MRAENGPYAYSGNQWVGYDSPQSLMAKMQYVIEEGLGGAMIWDLSLDDFKVSCYKCHIGNYQACLVFKGLCNKGNYPLLRSVNNALRAAGCSTG